MFHGRISLNSVLLLLLVDFVSRLRLAHHKYQVKPHLSQRFSAAFAAAILQRNYSFQINSSECKGKFRQASKCCKRVLEESNTSKKLGSQDFWRVANSVLNKCKSSICHLFNCLEVLSSASDKAKFF